MIGRYIIGWNDSATEKYRHRKLANLPVYHERQSFWLCAKHSLNNVLQQEAYTHNDLERVANQLHAQQQQQQASSWLSRNSHKNTFGFGDYDVNVITGALHERGLDLHWHDNRVPISQAMPSNCLGIIVHIRQSWLFRNGHWFAIKYFDSEIAMPAASSEAAGAGERRGPGFWNLDSKAEYPEFIGGKEELDLFVVQLTQKYQVHAMFVVPMQTPGAV
ncbi:Josephin-2 [Kickxella alabastrina]|uniref:Josephin-2 n=1 Tax=Kickxella alabastrina TaxID=61397 RepID=A0ACC1IIH2_9FUNG|nr:Josephin-2 [Kickxella alabastrina]